VSHPDETALLEYVAAAVSAEEHCRVDEHVAECDECLQRLRALFYLRDDFASVWASWTLREHGRLRRQVKLALALETVAESAPDFAEQARSWLGSIARSAVRAVNVLLDRAGETAGIGPGMLPDGYVFRLQPAVLGVGAPETEAGRRLLRTSELLAGGRINEAARELDEARKVDARLVQAAGSQITRQGKRQAQIVVDARRGYAALRYWPEEGEAIHGFVLLLPDTEPQRYLAAGLQSVEGEDFLVAEFRNVPAGGWEVYW